MVITYKVYEYFHYRDGEDVVEDCIETDSFEYEVEPDDDDLFDFLELGYELLNDQKLSSMTKEQKKFWREGAKYALKEIMRYDCFDEEDYEFVEFLKERYKEEAIKEAKEYFEKEVELQ